MRQREETPPVKHPRGSCVQTSGQSGNCDVYGSKQLFLFIFSFFLAILKFSLFYFFTFFTCNLHCSVIFITCDCFGTFIEQSKTQLSYLLKSTQYWFCFVQKSNIVLCCLHVWIPKSQLASPVVLCNLKSPYLCTRECWKRKKERACTFAPVWRDLWLDQTKESKSVYRGRVWGKRFTIHCLGHNSKFMLTYITFWIT